MPAEFTYEFTAEFTRESDSEFSPEFTYEFASANTHFSLSSDFRAEAS